MGSSAVGSVRAVGWAAAPASGPTHVGSTAPEVFIKGRELDMVGKVALVVGLGVGYVLGARDGRARYDQIKSQADRLWHDPKVQEKASQAQELAKRKAPQVQEKVADARGAGHKVNRDGQDESASTLTPPPSSSMSGGDL